LDKYATVVVVVVVAMVAAVESIKDPMLLRQMDFGL